MHERQSYILVTNDVECRHWLNHALAEAGEVFIADSPSIDRVLQLAEATGASVMFVHLTANDFRQESTLIEGIGSAKPFMPVLAVTDVVSEEMLLNAMRVGARDMVKIGARASEVVAAVRRLIPRESKVPSQKQSGNNGRITAVISARPGGDTPMLALHLALAEQELGPTLLLDLGIPHGDAMLYLGLTSTYSFIDAVRNLHRLDDTLIDTGFGRHSSGLSLLSMPEDPWGGKEFTSTDVYILLRKLRQHFAHIVINLGGIARSEFLTLLLANADNCILLIEQSVPSCRQNLQLMKYLREEKVNLEHTGFVVDRYLPHMPPDAASIAQSIGLPLLGTLAPSGMARLATMNSGESMFELSPNDSYTLSVRKLAKHIADGSIDTIEREKSDWWQQLLRSFKLSTGRS
jgi:pilus assembly protein CpaE